MSGLDATARSMSAFSWLSCRTCHHRTKSAAAGGPAIPYVKDAVPKDFGTPTVGSSKSGPTAHPENHTAAPMINKARIRLTIITFYTRFHAIETRTVAQAAADFLRGNPGQGWRPVSIPSRCVIFATLESTD
jgi:hypothetical protein